MQRKNLGTAMRYLVAVCALASALAIVACGGGGDEGGTTVTSGETISSVNTGSRPVNGTNVQALVNQPMAFSDGSIFDPSIPKNQQATLTFTSPSTATVASGGSTSSAKTTFGSCTFAFTTGPLAEKTITFTTCDFLITGSNVTVGGGAVSGTLTLTLSGPNGSSTSSVITVQISILPNGTLLINGVSTGIIISSNGTPTTTGTTGTGGQ